MQYRQKIKRGEGLHQ